MSDFLDADPVIARIPIHYTNRLAESLHLYQYPLQSRALEVPPTALAAGKIIKARHKATVGRVEIAVPVDVRPDVWNKDKAVAYGEGRAEEDREDMGLGEGDARRGKGKQREGVGVGEERLREVRLRSEKVPGQGDYMLGIMRDGWSTPLVAFKTMGVDFRFVGKLILHPISEVLQFRPSLTYMDILSRRAGAQSRRRAMGTDSDSESDGPPPDPDEPAPPPKEKEKGKKKESTSELPAREVQVTTRRVEDMAGGMAFPGGLSGVRREMLMQMRAESDDKWENLKWFDPEVRCLV